jgi:transcriptional regulator with PAS, ATPase and Fis domain
MSMTQPCKEVESLSQESAYAAEGFVTLNSRMLRILDIARRVAQTDVPILILGGVGCREKTFSNYIYRHSDRPGALREVNCAALPNELLESELSRGMSRRWAVEVNLPTLASGASRIL